VTGGDETGRRKRGKGKGNKLPLTPHVFPLTGLIIP
jgi:hypothetical protein